MIKSKPEHNVGEQTMTYRMAANAIWNKFNFARSIMGVAKYKEQVDAILNEAQTLADSIVHDEHSGDDQDVKRDYDEQLAIILRKTNELTEMLKPANMAKPQDPKTEKGCRAPGIPAF